MKRFLAALIVYPLMALLVIAGAIAFMIMPKGGATIAGIADSLWKLYKKDSVRKPTNEELEERRRSEQELEERTKQEHKDDLERTAFAEFVKEKLASEENRRLVREQGLEYYKIIKKEFESRKSSMKTVKLIRNFFTQLFMGQAIQIKATKPWLTLLWICLYLDFRELFRKHDKGGTNNGNRTRRQTNRIRLPLREMRSSHGIR